MYRSRFSSLVVLVALVLGSAACEPSGEGSSGDGASAGSMTASNATRAELLPTQVDALPSFDPAKFERLLAQLEGTPVIVNFWGSWCAPCRQEAPDLAKAARTYGDRIQFLGIDILDDRAGARAFIEEYGWTYPSLFDPGGSIRDELGLLGQPVTIFYAADGERIQELTWTGVLPPDELRAGIETLLT
jgi:cytochrome c biogenesis protein CcmG/thiol:disulfide interchange protein DsbE